MGDEDLEGWLAERRHLKPWARNLSMVDGFVAAVVCGPVSLHPQAWINPLLAIGPEAWDVGGTLEFAAIKAVGDRHNAITDRLVEDLPYQPVFRRTPNGDLDPYDWCEGFQLCIGLSRRKWKDVLDTSSVYHAFITPILQAGLIRPTLPQLVAIRPGLSGAPLPGNVKLNIPTVVAAMRKHFQLQRFGKPHPDTLSHRSF